MRQINLGNESENQPNLTLNERASLLLEYWKQTSNVQQHFNDVSMKLRNFAVVVFSGFLTGVGLAIHKNISITVFNFDVSAGVLFAAAGMFATQLIHFMDTYWYHVFLKGAVTASASIEKEIKEILGVTELSDGISNSSQQVCVVSVLGMLPLPKGWSQWMEKRPFSWVLKKEKVDSTKRHKIFYRGLLLIFLITGIGSMFTHPIDNSQNKIPPENKAVSIFHINTPPEFNDNQVELKKSGYIISGTNVRTRNLPDFEAAVQNLLPVGKEINVIEDNNDKSWVKVSYTARGKSVTGWVHRDYVATLK